MEKKNFKIIIGVLGIILGILIITIHVGVLLNIISFIVGGLVVITSFSGLMRTVSVRSGRKALQVFLNVCGIVLGIMLMLYSGTVVRVAIGVYMVIFPVIDIIMSKYKSEQLKVELPRILVGIFLLLIGPGTIVEAVIKVTGIVIIVLSCLSIAEACKKR